MPIRRPRKIVSDLSANVIEEIRLRALRDECDKIMLAGGKYEKLLIKAKDIKVGDQSRSEPDTRTVTATSNMNSAYPIVTFDDGNIQPYDKHEEVCVFRPTAAINGDHPIYVDHSQGYPRPDPFNGFNTFALIEAIEVGDTVCYEDQYDKPLRVYNIESNGNGHIHLMCSPLDSQKHGYGPIHIYGPSNKYVNKRKV